MATNLFMDIRILKKHRITPNQLLILQLIQDQDTQPFEWIPITIEDIENLIKKELVETVGSLAFNDLRLGKSFTDNLDWFETWWELWPIGVKSGGYYVKGDKAGCRSKLLRFIQKRPQFTQDNILNATQNYISRMRSHGYRGMQLASNFIEKNGVSVLAGECENGDYRSDFLEDA